MTTHNIGAHGKFKLNNRVGKSVPAADIESRQAGEIAPC